MQDLQSSVGRGGEGPGGDGVAGGGEEVVDLGEEGVQRGGVSDRAEGLVADDERLSAQKRVGVRGPREVGVHGAGGGGSLGAQIVSSPSGEGNPITTHNSQWGRTT